MMFSPFLRLRKTMVMRCCRVYRHYQQHNFSTQPAERLAGKVAIITGAASGIGKATAAEFINHGAKVILADVQRALGKAIADELGPCATFVACDVTQESDVATAVDLAVAKHGRLDVMHNNAGIAGPLAFDFAEIDLAEFDRTMAVNVRSVVAGIKHAARVMVPRRAGCILCTASISGVMAGVAPHAYTVSKTAVLGAARSAAAELSKHGIRVNCISPHALPTPFGVNSLRELLPGLDVQRATEMIEGTGELAGTKCEAADIAKAAVFLASDEAKYISGHNLVVDGAFTTYKSLKFPNHD
ncbi:hypothetical protein Cni_G15461 [Canna indica]|uniref:Uncharacterized protein n=1 Tax=Canna indica TaxID=4628 RepID=A0AAQ3KE55_9LILI|nr:hypothetical protein Cni_G15461 [Canna indica]